MAFHRVNASLKSKWVFWFSAVALVLSPMPPDAHAETACERLLRTSQPPHPLATLGEDLGGQVISLTASQIQSAFQGDDEEPDSTAPAGTFSVTDSVDQSESVMRLTREKALQASYGSLFQDRFGSAGNGMLVEVGSTKTEVVVGNDSGQVIQKFSRTLPVGSKSPVLRIRKFRMPAVSISAQFIPSANVLLNSDSGYEALREIHRRKRGRDIFLSGLDLPTLELYLGSKGANDLKKASKQSEYSSRKKELRELPAKLIILKTILKDYHLKQFYFGAPAARVQDKEIKDDPSASEDPSESED